MDGVEVLVAILLAVGTVGTVLPLVPGIGLAWGAGLLYGLSEGFGGVGTAAFAVMTILAALGTLAGFVVPARVAGAAGAARTSVLLGAALGIVGFFVIPVVGLAIGGVLGVYVGEHLRTQDATVAWRSTWATIKGFGLATLLQLAAALAMSATWAAWALAD
ncbi:MAG TPA: DUF456 domain-containing protein [Acidimicrobiales bacterium]|jgi:uncharacterized protein YqgC (DUF456 family)|nr:DUF456 domain-containing protein [Acidimicrobiales bacterium]